VAFVYGDINLPDRKMSGVSMPTIRAKATSSIAAMFSTLTSALDVRRARQMFKKDYINFSSQSLKAFQIQATQKPEQTKSANQVDITKFVAKIVECVDGKLVPTLRKSDQAFLVGVPEVLMEMGLTGKKLAEFLEKAKTVESELKGRSKLVMDIMHELAPRSHVEWAEWFPKPDL
jgi:hypothetical protein